jgi:hypothetical protein
MAWRIVVQPDGLYAWFSTAVDMFTRYDITYHEALEVCLEELGRKYDPEKIQAGIDEGQDRWKSSLLTIHAVHGKAYHDIVVKAIVDKDPVAQKYIQEH